MAFRINSNVEAMNSQRNLNRVSGTLSRTFERLSSGLRINSARDDAAGLAITDRFSAQTRSLNQAVRNANDGISIAQVAEAAMSEETNLLLRMRELAVQSANDTNTTTDRTSIQAEVEQLVSELNRIGNNSQFNNMNLLDGTMNDAYIHVGAQANQTISLSFWDSRATALGARAQTTGAAVGAAAIAAGDVTIDGVGIAASIATDDTKSLRNASFSAIAKAAAVNKSSGQHGVVAEVGATTRTGGAAVAAGNLAAGDLVINGVDIGLVSGVQANDADGRLVAAVNAKAAATGVTASLDGAHQLVLTAADGRNVTTSGTAAGLAIDGFAAAEGTSYGTVKLTDDESFTVGGANVAARLGINAGTYNVDFTQVVSTISLTTRQGANDALGILDTAINQVASRRGDLGAVQNRLQSTVSNLEAVVENLSAAASRIKDADFAQETAEMTRAQILQQAATSMLSQANQAPQGVLSLLR